MDELRVGVVDELKLVDRLLLTVSSVLQMWKSCHVICRNIEREVSDGMNKGVVGHGGERHIRSLSLDEQGSEVRIEELGFVVY